MGVQSHAQKHNTMHQPGPEHRLLDLEVSVLQYRSEISELRIRSLYTHTRMTIRVYAYDNTRIRV